MALKTLMLRKRLDDANKSLETIREAESELEKREAELETAISEAETEEEKSTVEEEVEKFEEEKTSHEEVRQSLEAEIEKLEAQLAEEEARSEEAVTEAPESQEERTESKTMELRDYSEEEMQERSAFANLVRGIETRDYNMTQGSNGAIVPKTIANEIVTKVREICPIFEKASHYDVKGTLEVPFYPYSTDHVISAAYSNEMAQLTASVGDFGTVEMTGFVAGAFAQISKKLINNTDVDIVPFIVDQMAEAFKVFLENELINGTDDKATGLLAGISAGATVTATHKSSVNADELIAVQMKVPTAYQQNSCWIMAPATFELIRKLKYDDDKYVLTSNFAEGFGYTILGKPVYLSDNMPALGTANNKAIVYGDLSALGVKLTSALEIQIADPVAPNVFAVGVTGWTEFDAKVVNAQKVACIKCGSSDPQ